MKMLMRKRRKRTLWWGERDRGGGESAPHCTLVTTLIVEFHKDWWLRKLIWPAEYWTENGVGCGVECHHHPVSHPTTLREDQDHDDNWKDLIMILWRWSFLSHIFLVVTSPDSLEGAVCWPKGPKEQPSLHQQCHDYHHLNHILSCLLFINQDITITQEHLPGNTAYWVGSVVRQPTLLPETGISFS